MVTAWACLAAIGKSGISVNRCDDCCESYSTEDIEFFDEDEYPELAAMTYCINCWDNIQKEILAKRAVTKGDKNE